jgi:hypothetical protein
VYHPVREHHYKQDDDEYIGKKEDLLQAVVFNGLLTVNTFEAHQLLFKGSGSCGIT